MHRIITSHPPPSPVCTFRENWQGIPPHQEECWIGVLLESHGASGRAPFWWSLRKMGPYAYAKTSGKSMLLKSSMLFQCPVWKIWLNVSDKLGSYPHWTWLKGFGRFPMIAEDHKKTVFGAAWGLFEFCRMLFGLHGMAAMFQHLMDGPLVYIHVIIFSECWEQHIETLCRVLQKLREATLTANPGKCKLAQKETQYLGYQMGQETIQAVADKIQAPGEYERPVTKKQVKSFMGLTKYFCKFIPHFLEIMASLTDLTKSHARAGLSGNWRPKRHLSR